MAKEIENMTIYEKLAGIRKMVEVIRKNKAGFNYKYVSEDEILARVTAGMDKYRVLLYPGIVPQTTTITPYHYVKTKNVKGGGTVEENVNEVLVNADMVFTWVNLDNPKDQLTIPWLIVGQQSDASQAVGSGLSYLHRYFLLKFFQIATPDDDPDNWRSKQEDAARQEEKLVVKEIVSEIHTMVSNRLSEIQDPTELKKVRAEFSALVKKYARDESGKPTADYFRIETAQPALTLLDELKKLIGGNK